MEIACQLGLLVRSVPDLSILNTILNDRLNISTDTLEILPKRVENVTQLQRKGQLCINTYKFQLGFQGSNGHNGRCFNTLHAWLNGDGFGSSPILKHMKTLISNSHTFSRHENTLTKTGTYYFVMHGCSLVKMAITCSPYANLLLLWSAMAISLCYLFYCKAFKSINKGFLLRQDLISCASVLVNDHMPLNLTLIYPPPFLRSSFPYLPGALSSCCWNWLDWNGFPLFAKRHCLILHQSANATPCQCTHSGMYAHLS